MITARGISGQLSFDGQSVTITRRGLLPWLLTGSGGTKSVPLKSVSAVQHRKCGFYQGYLQLSIAGELEGGGHRTSTHLPFVKDENTIVFYFKSNAAFLAFADQLRAAIRDAANGLPPQPLTGQAPAAPTASASAASSSATVETGPTSNQIFADITRLAGLRDSGAITPSEFISKKSELLSRL